MLNTPTIVYSKSESEVEAQIGDNTILVLPLSQPLTKQEVELAQARHFQKAVAGNPEWAFDIVLAQDRPDFRIRRGNTELGLDVAAFASTERRRATDQFRKLKMILMAAYHQGRLKECEGIEVQVFFSKERLPQPAEFEKSASEFIAALESYKVDQAAWEQIDSTSFLAGTNPYPMGEIGSTTDGTMKWHVSGLVTRENLFTRICGFNIEHQFAERMNAEKAALELQRIIDKHDVAGQGIDELVLVAGGPDAFGEATGGESTIIELFIEMWDGTISWPKHLNRIYVDNWLSGKATLIFDRKQNFVINSAC